LSINIQEEAKTLFNRNTEKLYQFYESLAKENILISELKNKLLEVKF